MRKSSLVCLIAVLFLLAGTFSASASTVSLRWVGSSDASATGLGTNAILVPAGGGTTLTLDLVIGADALGLSAFGLDLEFDVGTEFDDELEILSFQEFSWANAKAARTLEQFNIGITRTQESGALGPEGQLFGFEAFTIGSGPISATLSFARIVFRTNPSVATDSLDIFATNERDAFATAFFDNAGNQITFDLNDLRASVGVLPEPQSVAMLALAVGTLVAAGWRRS